MKAESLSCGPVCTLVVSSPIGDIEIHSCPSGLHSVKQCAPDDTTFHPDESRPVEVKEISCPSKIKTQADEYSHRCVGWLQNYFTKRLANPDIPPLCPAVLSKGVFRNRAWGLLPKAAQFGAKVTYAELAQLCGNRQASRAAGQAMALNPISLLIPCHRVIPSTGGVGNYHHGKKNLIKNWLLEFENGEE